MKFTISTDEFSRALGAIIGAVETNILPALEGFKIEAQGEQVHIIGSNNTYGISTRVPATVQENGEIVLNAQTLFGAVKKLSGDYMTVSANAKLATVIRSGTDEYKITGIPAADYAELPAITDAQSLTIKATDLRRLIASVKYAAAKTPAQPQYQGILLKTTDNGELEAVALDGYRLALARTKIDGDAQMSVIVPEKFLSDVLKTLGDGDDELVRISYNPTHIILQAGGYVYLSRLLVGDFVDYKTVIPATSTTTATIKVADAIKAVDAVSPVLQTALKRPTALKVSDSEYSLRANSTAGEATARREAQTTGGELTIGINNRFLFDALKACDTDEVNMVLKNATSPLLIKPVTGDEFVHLILPVRLKGNEAE